jgi:hypothetical protein
LEDGEKQRRISYINPALGKYEWMDDDDDDDEYNIEESSILGHYAVWIGT